jgi:hypothetical protein
MSRRRGSCGPPVATRWFVMPMATSTCCGNRLDEALTATRRQRPIAEKHESRGGRVSSVEADTSNISRRITLLLWIILSVMVSAQPGLPLRRPLRHRHLVGRGSLLYGLCAGDRTRFQRAVAIAAGGRRSLSAIPEAGRQLSAERPGSRTSDALLARDRRAWHLLGAEEKK